MVFLGFKDADLYMDPRLYVLNNLISHPFDFLNKTSCKVNLDMYVIPRTYIYKMRASLDVTGRERKWVSS